MMGPMANPFYHDLGLSKDAVGAVRASIGLPASLLGIAAGGYSALRFGYFRTLIVGVVLQSVVIAAFALLAYSGPDIRVFGAVMTGPLPVGRPRATTSGRTPGLTEVPADASIVRV